jgi:hypothetical protein
MRADVVFLGAETKFSVAGRAIRLAVRPAHGPPVVQSAATSAGQQLLPFHLHRSPNYGHTVNGQCCIVLKNFHRRSWLLIPILCGCRRLLLLLITLSETHTRSVWLLWTKDRPIVDTSTVQFPNLETWRVKKWRKFEGTVRHNSIKLLKYIKI